MKKINFLFLVLIPIWAGAQMKTWENFTYDGIKHPFLENNLSKPNVDSKGNTWVLNTNSIWKIKGDDTTQFTNFPETGGNKVSSNLSILGDQVTFLHYSYTYEGNQYEYTNYLGFYNGSEMTFFNETVMNGPSSKRAFSKIIQTQKYVWLSKPDKLVSFDKNNTFRSYTLTGGPVTDVISNSSIIQTDSVSILFHNHNVLYVLDDIELSWNKLLGADSTQYVLNSDSSKTTYIVGKKNIYSYGANSLKTFEVEDLATFGQIVSIKEFKKNTFLVNFNKGFVLIDNGNVHTRKFADYTTETNVYYNEDYRTKSSYLDNGILIIKFEANKTKHLYFSLYNNELIHEGTRNTNYTSFLYKKINGDKYFYYSTYDQSKYPAPNLLNIIKNDIDTTVLSLPKEIQYIMGISVDSQYIWINNEQQSQSPYRIFRMKENQYFIKGKLFYDVNQNGLKEANEPGVSKFPLVINPSGIMIYPDRDGNFAFAGVPGEKYTLEIPADSLFNYISQTLPYTIKETESNHIGFTIANPKPEIQTNFVTPWPRCGTTGTAKLQIFNTGFETIEKAKFILIGDQSAEINSTDAITIKEDTLIFELTNLSPINPQSFSYEVTFPGADMTGQPLTFQLNSELFVNGSVAETTNDIMTTIVRCSYDPNDKSVTPAGVGSENFTLKGETLSYLIRFENTGNDTAYTVTVYDTLDTNLDATTFRLLGSSHNVITELTNSGVLIFHFEDIMLPDNKTNYDKAQGFVRFAITPQKGLAENTALKNKAGIVFDSNPPVMTNETLNTLVTTLPQVSGIDKMNNLQRLIYPNPATDIVNISIAAYAEIYDFTGRKVYTSQGTTINVSNWEKGIYIFRLFDSNGFVTGTEKVLLTK